MTATGDYAVGIDVGTTFTAAATCRGDHAEVVTLGDRGDVIPSVVYLREDGVLLVGHAAERRAVADATRVARAFKRRIGDDVPLSLGGRPYTAEALTAAIVRWVVDLVTAREGGPPGRILLTLPASWRDHRRELLLDAAAAAGVDGAAVLAEPVAAAIHYASRHPLPPGATVGIYDLGGGTFDATIVRRVEHGFEIVGQPQGDGHLGGIDLDALVWDHVVGVIGTEALDPEGDPTPAHLRAVAQVRAAAVDAKEALSYDTQAVVPVTLPRLATEVRITRAEFEEMARPALLRTIEVFGRTCEAAGLAAGDLRAVLLAGGSSRIPLIAQLVGHELGARVASDAHPKLATCLGAARAAVIDGWGTAAGTGPVPAATAVGAGPEPAGTTAMAAAAEPDPDDTVVVPLPPPDLRPGPAPGPEQLPPEGDSEGGSSRRNRVAAVVAAVLLAAAVAGALLLRGGPEGVAGPDGEQATTATTTSASSTTTTATTTPVTTTEATTDTTEDTTEIEALGSSDGGGNEAPASTTSSSTVPEPAPEPGSPCDPADGDPDCTDQSVDGTFRIVSGYADCIASLGAGSGLCTDLDGDGLAGYPDTG